MDIVNVGIFTNDLGYGIALGNKLTHFHTEYLVSICGLEELGKNEKANSMDLVLTDEPSEDLTMNIVELVESRSCAYENDELMIYKVYKYGNVKELATKLSYIYGRIYGRKQISSYNISSRLVFFCSPYGGSGVTSISKGVAEEISRFMDQKVIYLSLEEIQEQEENSEIRSLGEYLYHIEKDSHITTYIESFLVQERYGYDRFKKAGGRNPLKELEVDEFIDFINIIAGTARYDYILIDSGQDFSESVIVAMRRSHKICIIESEFRNHSGIEILEAYLKTKIGDGFISKLVKSMNNCSYDERDETNNIPIQTIPTNVVEIDYDPRSFKQLGEQGQASIDLDFGKGIKKLAKMIM